jgi:hypothetical protein
MQFKCQKCKKILSSEDEARQHSKENAGHNRFDFKTIGIVREVEG